MRLLSFDTTSPALNLCLYDGSVVATERLEPTSAPRQEAAAMLVPAIDKLTAGAGWRKDELSALCVNTGPGSFTGIRTGLVTARTLAHALGLPLLGVSRFECFASAVPRPVGIILFCGPGLYFAAAYKDRSEGSFTPILEPAYVPAADISETLSSTGRWLAEPRALAELSEKKDTSWPSVSLERLPELGNIAVEQAQIAWDRLSFTVPGCPDPEKLAGEFHWMQVEPLYLRGPSVTKKR